MTTTPPLRLTHLDDAGHARMVDVTAKQPTVREAVAVGEVRCSPTVMTALREGTVPKGDVLAVANRPSDSAYDRALTGLYPPGSTFKVVSTAALLRAGLDPDRTVDCPRTLAVEGKLDAATMQLHTA